MARAEAMRTILLALLVIMPDARLRPDSLTQTSPCAMTNLVVATTLRPVIDHMWHTSLTFKAQCARLSQAPALVVRIGLGNQSQVGARGRVEFVRAEGAVVRAEIMVFHELRTITEIVEVLAHELEHVIEQLDGVQLIPDSTHGVHRTASGAFETARALHVGQTVSGEVEAARERARKAGPR